MNPMRGVQPLGHGLRAATGGLDRANRDVSEEEAWSGLDPMRSAHGVVAKANEPLRTGCWRRRAMASALAVKSPSSPVSLTFERPRIPARGLAPGSQRDTL